MLEIRLAEAAGSTSRTDLNSRIFDERFLLRRPLMQAIDFESPDEAPVLLIDELDRADEPFEAYLLEVLSDFQITVPEIGRFQAPCAPIVVITSNRTREVHDAVKRRCLYHWVDYPDALRELAIIERKVPGASSALARQVVDFVQRLRTLDLFKNPGVAETIDWCNALLALDQVVLDPQIVDDTLGALLKYQDDIARVRGPEAARLLTQSRAGIDA
jgi:MoxR-like ATPase